MKLVLLGAPGVGKGTNAKYLAERLNIVHISTGDMFRQNIKEGTELGLKVQNYLDQGMLVPDELTTELVKERLSQDDAKAGFLLDGYPRTLEQAKALDAFTKIDAVVQLHAPKKAIMDRIAGRRAKAKEEDQRSDEAPEVVARRLQVYEELTTPLIDYYRNEDLLHEIDVTFDLSEWEKITAQYDEMFEELKNGERS